MPGLVSLSRAAKLVGTTRGALQKKIHDNELISFEGQVKLEDIEKLYPDAEIEDNHIIEDLEKIIERALKKARGAKLAKLLAPDTRTLATRLKNITTEHAHSKYQLNALLQLYTKTEEKLNQLASNSNQKDEINELVQWLHTSVTEIQEAEYPPANVQQKDTILRVFAAQVHITNTGHEYFVEGNNSILEAGLSAGLALNYGCSNGNCGKCKAKLLSGKIKKIKPHDYALSESEKLQEYFLCCSNTALTDIEIEADEAGSEKDIPQQQIDARVKKVEPLAGNVAVLNLKTPRTNRLRFLAGQGVNLSYADLEPLSIPIASCPCDDMNIQFHIPLSSDHELAKLIGNGLKNSDTIRIDGPSGSFILDEDSNNAVIFIAFNTGFAPVKSLIEHAVTLEHAPFIHLYWIHEGDKPYLHNHCRAWEDALDDFKYAPLQSATGIEELKNCLTREYSDFSDKNIYLCGNENEVKQVKDFLTEQNMNDEQLKSQVI